MSIVLNQLTKHYDNHPVVDNVSLEVADGEFFVFLGPSGSGKSTVLRMIAGLADVEGGRVFLHGQDVTHLPPQRRGVGLVFQHYALFRHMTVSENVEFALRIRKVPGAERRRRRDELLEMVGLGGLGARLPRQLSGGQQQRVALARALAHRPQVLLLDEPFGALDARIRSELRRTIQTIQRELGITTIFVTHDQEEAFELADRLGVMNFGRLLECGSPQELYLRPQTEFVATFLGTANLMVGECSPGGVRLGPVNFELSTAVAGGEARRVQVLFRPEDVAVKDSGEALDWPLLGQATVEEVRFSGSFERLRLRLPGLPGVRPIAPPAPFGGNFLLVEATRSQHQARRFPLQPGEMAWVGVRRLHALSHPGLSFLVVSNGSVASGAAIELCGEMARLANARVMFLAQGQVQKAHAQTLDSVRESLGSGLASVECRATPEKGAESIAAQTEGRHYDLLVHGLPSEGAVALAESLLQHSEQHLLLVPGPRRLPTHALICVEVGEPGKEDILFTGRLIRHLGAKATILTVLPREGDTAARGKVERFLAAGMRTLDLLGVPARSVVRIGLVLEEVRRELVEGAQDLLVVGAPLADRRGRISLGGLIGSLIEETSSRPVMIVRSQQEGWASL